MPMFEYCCQQGHITEELRSYAARDEFVGCRVCTIPALRIEISHGHVPPSGVYSYAPNIGSANQFERRQQALKDGVKVIPKIND